MSYTHGEAFMLMTYRCQKCGRMELIWNSRDGVTPFGIDCLKCPQRLSDGRIGIAVHIDWQRDVRDPDFGKKLAAGIRGTDRQAVERVFVTITREKAAASALKRLESFIGTEYPPPERGTPEWDELLAAITEDFWHKGEAPDVLTVEEYLATQ